MEYKIIQSSSKGNCLIINKTIAIDMGVSFKKIRTYLKDLKIVLLTHIHIDHFNKTCIKQIAFNKPTIKFICRDWLVDNLIKLGVDKKNIWVLKNMKTYDLGVCFITPIDTYHDVPNTSYLIDLKPIKLYYATDTYKLDYLSCLKNLDYYFIEKNYNEEEIKARIEEKQLNGEFTYEYRVLNSHMSEEETNKFLLSMMGDNSKFIYCHEHKRKEDENDKDNY